MSKVDQQKSSDTVKVSVKDTTLPGDYVLVGKHNEINNYDEFSWYISAAFAEALRRENHTLKRWARPGEDEGYAVEITFL